MGVGGGALNFCTTRTNQIEKKTSAPLQEGVRFAEEALLVPRVSVRQGFSSRTGVVVFAFAHSKPPRRNP